jgi:menaquinone-specific isochorismate synthase
MTTRPDDAAARPAVAPATGLVVRTTEIDLVGPLLHRLPTAHGALAWMRDGDGLIGWGEALRVTVSGPNRFALAKEWWRAIVGNVAIEDEVGVRGTGPVAFGSFAFAPGEQSVLVLPRVLIGRSAGRAWITSVGEPPRLASPQPVRAPRGVRYAQGDVPVTAYRTAVARAVELIAAGRLDKVVLAHDLLAAADEPIDPRWLLSRLAEGNPSCYAFAVEGLVGATPELLVRLADGDVTSRVLAGTTARGADESAQAAGVAALLESTKNQEEHRYAVESLRDALAGHVTDLVVPEHPSSLELSNVTHLATDVSARVTDGSDVLDLLAALHPTAAVGGTPTDVALDVIAELEPMMRGRYAGPVGWLDARGDGEWGIALRTAALTGETARLYAGCGIVAGSDPDAEVLEAQAKFIPVRDALEGGPDSSR